MCLGIPGEVISVSQDIANTPTAMVQFGGIQKEINISFTPEVEKGQYVIVHVGFSISIINAEEADKIYKTLEELKLMES